LWQHPATDKRQQGARRVNRKAIFDAVRAMLNRSFTRAEVQQLDAACAQTEAQPIMLGSLSEEFESGGRGPGTVSSGSRDPGGVSYGTYQLASRTGTCTAFIAAEGKQWATRFAGTAPGQPAFTSAWKAVAAAEPDAFRTAQHAFIERTHYRPLIAAIIKRTGFDLDQRHRAVRDAVWSCSVQHGAAAGFIARAVAAADACMPRAGTAYDPLLVEEIYRQRSAYVRALAGGASVPPGERGTLLALAQTRYPRELAKALAMFE
jgi:hypothetical protein